MSVTLFVNLWVITRDGDRLLYVIVHVVIDSCLMEELEA
jgi:hypothetical protein